MRHSYALMTGNELVETAETIQQALQIAQEIHERGEGLVCWKDNRHLMFVIREDGSLVWLCGVKPFDPPTDGPVEGLKEIYERVVKQVCPKRKTGG